VAVITQREREMIAQRTRGPSPWPVNDSQSKARHGAAAFRRARRGNTAAIVAIGATADKRAKDLRETIMDVVASGSLSHDAIAAELSSERLKLRAAGAGIRWALPGCASGYSQCRE